MASSGRQGWSLRQERARVMELRRTATHTAGKLAKSSRGFAGPEGDHLGASPAGAPVGFSLLALR